MRPVRLDIDGFASFREPASVDFTDVDHFALVGATGSGKSTLIDAICFALYGTAPRWGRANAVSDALAPTANRAVVSLVFDLGDQRYQAVREVRRSGASVQTRTARLERYLDPTVVAVPGDAPATEVLVSEARAMTPAVAELLGMEFDDFCQCVVLPQGEFATFLRATSGERQKILLKLLGADVYQRMHRAAAARAKEAQAEANVLSEQLGTVAATTPELVAEARARHEELVRLADLVRDEVQTWREAEAERTDAEQQLHDLTELVTRARAVTAPEGVRERQQALATARAELAAHEQAVDRARRVEQEARAAAAAAPTRAHLEQVTRRRDELHQCREQLHDARARAELAAEELRTGRTRAAAARDEAQEAARTQRELDQAHRDATSLLAQLEARAARTAAVAGHDLDVPDVEGPAARLEQAETAAKAAALHSATAQADVGQLPGDTDLDQQAARCDEVAALRTSRTGLRSELARLAEVTAGARELEKTAEEDLDRAESALESARRSSAAGQLRSHLSVGDRCPVCTHEVTSLPNPLDSEDLSRATQQRDRARRAVQDARAAHQQALTHERAQAARLDTLDHEIAGKARWNRDAALHSALAAGVGAAELPLPEAADDDAAWAEFNSRVAALVSSARDAATARREQAADAARRAEAAETDAAAAREAWQQARTAADAARHALFSLHSGVVPDNAPGLDPHDLTRAWATLRDWAHDLHRQVVDRDLPEARRTTDELAGRVAAALAAVQEREAHRAETEAEERRLTADESSIRTTRDSLTTRVRALDEELAGAPSAEDLPEALRRADELADRVDTAQQASNHAAVALARARVVHDESIAAHAPDREALGAARDALARWSPPTFTAEALDATLGEVWDELLGWARSRAEEAEAAALGQRSRAERAAERASGATTALAGATGRSGLDVPEADLHPSQVETFVAVAVEAAAWQVRESEKDLRAASDLRGKIDAANERAVVAAELASLLRGDKFQQWLAGAALDQLVLGASESLTQLSEGRFSLTHEKGDFFVIDHYDADSRRSVKTLSGGETFQTSLALALALSDQLASLASGGAAKLESIFLDEGFGTLDPDSLETVAATLESLAQGRRMVGVVTHVAALAERIPVRFMVTRDHVTSRVERESE